YWHSPGRILSNLNIVERSIRAFIQHFIKQKRLPKARVSLDMGVNGHQLGIILEQRKNISCRERGVSGVQSLVDPLHKIEILRIVYGPAKGRKVRPLRQPANVIELWVITDEKGDMFAFGRQLGPDRRIQ